MAGCAGAKAITSFPHSTEPSPDTAPTTKDSLRFPTVSMEPLLPPLNPNLVLRESSALLSNLLQSSGPEPLPLPSHQDRELPRTSPFSGLSIACWPENEDEPPGPAHTSQGQATVREVGVPGGARHVRGAGGEACNTEPGGLWGAGRRRTSGRAHNCSPGPSNARETDTRQNKTQAPQSLQRFAYRGPGTRRRERSCPGGGARRDAPAVPFRCIDGQAAGARSGLAQRVSHLVIHYQGVLSGPRAALSPPQAFVIPTYVLVSLG